MVVNVLANTALSVGVFWYAALFLVAGSLLLFVHIKSVSKKRPNYGFVLINESMLMLRLCCGIPFCTLLYGVICIFADFQGPRSDILSSLLQMRSNNIVTPIILSGLTVLVFLLVLNAYSLTYNTRRQFTPKLPTGKEVGAAADVCVISIWNGFWGAAAYKHIGKADTTITCVDEWTHPSTRGAIDNMVAEGVPEEALERVHSSFGSLPLPSNKYDGVVAVHCFRALPTDEDKLKAIHEMVRVLKPNGKLFMLVPVFNAGSTKSLVTRAEMVDITMETCWKCFFPVTMIIGIKNPNAPPAPTTHTVSLGGGISFNGNGKQPGLNINEESTLEVREVAPLLPNHEAALKPTLPQLRGFLMAILTIFMIGYVLVLYFAWPVLDIPASIQDYNRLTSGWLAPIATSFVLIWAQIHESLRDDSCDKEITPKLLIMKFCKYFLLGFVFSGVFNVIFWLPSMLIDLYMVTHQVSPSTAGLVNIVVVVVLFFVGMKLGRYLSEREAASKKK